MAAVPFSDNPDVVLRRKWFGASTDVGRGCALNPVRAAAFKNTFPLYLRD
jgi:hypothetical protein